MVFIKEGFLTNAKNDFWRGLYIVSCEIEVRIHKFTIWAFRHVNYTKVLNGMKTDENRHNWKRRR